MKECMRTAKVYGPMPHRRFRSEITTCSTCTTRLRRYATRSERPVITLDGPLRVTHRGYRCPNPDCAPHPRTYRSAAAAAFALPGFPFGLDLVVVVGHLRLTQQ